MKNRFIFLLALFIAFTVFNLNAQSNKLLTAVQERYSAIADFSADFRTSSNGKGEMTGKIFYKKGNKARIEMKNVVLITDGKTTWSHNKKDNKVVINDFAAADAQLLSLDEILFNYPKKSEVSTVTEQGREVLLFTPKKGSGLRFNNAKLFTDGNNLIEKVIITNAPGNVSEINLSGYQLNKNINDSRFSYTPPEGSTVIDLR